MEVTPGKRYLNAVGLAAYLGISRWTVYELVDKRQIPFFKIGAALRFDTQAIDKWTEKRMVPAVKLEAS